LQAIMSQPEACKVMSGEARPASAEEVLSRDGSWQPAYGTLTLVHKNYDSLAELRQVRSLDAKLKGVARALDQTSPRQADPLIAQTAPTAVLKD
jgi:hypothetical protein